MIHNNESHTHGDWKCCWIMKKTIVAMNVRDHYTLMKRYFWNKCLPSVFSIDSLNIIKQIMWNMNITKFKWITYCLLIRVATFLCLCCKKELQVTTVIFSATFRSVQIHCFQCPRLQMYFHFAKTYTWHWPLLAEIMCSSNIYIFLLPSGPLYWFYRLKYFIPAASC